MSSKVEINFVRLLNRCEILAKNKENLNWRLEKVYSIVLMFLLSYEG